jgi:hypothetical protein
MKLDKTKSYGTISGGHPASFTQNGMFFDSNEDLMNDDDIEEEKEEDMVIDTPEVSSARTFLIAVLKSGPKMKSVVFKAAEDTNIKWEDVKNAAALMNLVKFKFKNQETWKLPEDLM